MRTFLEIVSLALILVAVTAEAGVIQDSTYQRFPGLLTSFHVSIGHGVTNALNLYFILTI